MYQSKVILTIPGFPFVSAALVVTTPLSCLMFVILPFFSLLHVARGLPVLLVFSLVMALLR